VGAGRTDAGVHALGQVMTTPDAPDDFDTVKLREALNSLCGPHIAVTACRPTDESFHARFSARSRLYVYAILEAPTPDPFLARTTLHHPRPLSIEAMNEAAGHLVGRHDFSSFGRVPEGASGERTLFELRCYRTGPLLRVRARANAFIQQMVRALVGTLIETGEGKRSPDEARGALAARNRAAAGPVAPPQGLCLVSVDYEEGWSVPLRVDEFDRAKGGG
jgi:tRNA pseudouridine38-40 synthase